MDLIADLGGAMGKNVERDARRRMNNLFGIQLQPYNIMVTVSTDSGMTTSTSLPTLPVFEVFSELHRHQRMFHKSILGPRGHAGPTHFWKSLSSKSHHVATSPDWEEYRNSTVPLDFHVDGVEVFRGTEYSVWSWSSSLVHGIHSYDMQFPLCVIATASIVPGTTDKQIIDYIAWNFDVLESGLFPECGYLGASLDQARPSRSLQTLAGGWFGTFHAWTGDLKEKVREHKFVRNYQATFLCEWCVGSRKEGYCCAYDFSSSATWRHTKTTHAHYLATHSATQRSPWCALSSWTIFPIIWTCCICYIWGSCRMFAARCFI